MQFLLTVFHCKAMQAKMALIFIWRSLFQWQSSLGAAICQSLWFFFSPCWNKHGKVARQMPCRAGLKQAAYHPLLQPTQDQKGKEKSMKGWPNSIRWKETPVHLPAFFPNRWKALNSLHLSTFPRDDIIWDYAGRLEHNIYNKKHVFLKRQ